MSKAGYSIIFLLILLLKTGCQKPADNWQQVIPGAGSLSSPKTVDLNQDGILDIVLGAGKEEFLPADTGIVAFDGNDGHLLWVAPAKDQMFGSPVFHDITGDKIPDLFITGREAQLIAIDGSSGSIIWDFSQVKGNQKSWYNFYNPQLIQMDRLMLLVANGGDVTVQPYNPRRPPGKLLLLNAINGQIISRDTMPDGRETYFSPAIHKSPLGEMIIFGTGGETLGGGLYAVPLQELVKGNIQKARVLANDSLKGFIAPPVLTDIDGDATDDIIVNAVNGRLLAINGKNYNKIWEIIKPGYEVYAAPCPGYFNNDRIPDFFANFSKGIWPDVVQCQQIIVDGKNGEIIFSDSSGFFQMASPVSIDLDQDNFDEVILSLNYEHHPETTANITLPPRIKNHLLVFDINDQKKYPLTSGIEGANMAITPWLGDLDQDNQLDIIYGSHHNRGDFTAFKNLTVQRLELPLPLPDWYWGSYMGNKSNCRY